MFALALNDAKSGNVLFQMLWLRLRWYLSWMWRQDGRQLIRCFVSPTFGVWSICWLYAQGRALDFKDAIAFYWSEPDFDLGGLSSVEWSAIEKVADWLKVFWSATTQMSTTKCSMLSSTHAVFFGLQEKLQDIIATLPSNSAADNTLKEGLLAAHRKLSDYFHKFDQSRYYLWAAHAYAFSHWPLWLIILLPSVLDPRISYETLKEEFRDDAILTTNLEFAKDSLSDHYHAFYASTATVTTQESTSTQSPVPDSPENIDFTSRYQKRHASSSIRDEIQEYFRITSVPEPLNQVDPIQWWYTRQEQFPNLYRLARNVLCIPGMYSLTGWNAALKI